MGHAQKRESMTEQTVWDALVVGGGINGVGIVRDLAGCGARVLLVEQDDLAQHTSSASTKLIHGGCATSNTASSASCAKHFKSVKSCCPWRRI